MIQEDLEDIVSFAKAKGVMNKPFTEVLDMYNKDMADYALDYEADHTLIEDSFY